MTDQPTASVHISIPDVTLTADEVFPDGWDGEPFTADDVAALIRNEGPLPSALSAWNLIDRVDVTVTYEAPNPNHGQNESLIPDLAPDPVITQTTTATIRG